MSNIFQRVVQADGSKRRRHTKLNLTKGDPMVKSVVEKLVTGNSNNTQIRTNNAMNRTVDLGGLGHLQTVSDSTRSSVMDAKNIFQLLPDNELAMQILVSSILSPKDLTKVELTFGLAPRTVEAELGGTLLNVVSDHFENNYKITKLLPRILEDTLFKTGSYPLLVLPENSIDDVINNPSRVSMEAISDQLTVDGKVRPVGLLGDPSRKATGPSLGLEAFDQRTLDRIPRQVAHRHQQTPISLGLEVTDNPSVLKLPVLRDKIRQDRVHDVYRRSNLGLEDRVSEDVNSMSLYRPRRYRGMPLMQIRTQDQLERGSVGHPLVMKLPSESVIPVYVPANPEEHIGYFILLEPNGHPVASAEEADYYQQLSQNMKANSQLASSLITSTNLATHGRDYDYLSHLEEATKAYTAIVESDLRNRLQNGLMGEEVEIARPHEVYRIMLARSFANMQTQILYVPAELLTYIAFDYDQFGVGKSLLENGKLIASIRAVLLFANTMAAVKNSVQHTKLNINLSPEDPDPASTVEFLVHEYAKVRRAGYPLAASNPLDIVNFLQNAGVQVAVQGNAAYPQTQVDVEGTSQNVTRVDTDLDENMKRRQLMSFGLSPETVDMGMNVDFATSIVTNNLLLAKRVMLYQDELVPQLQHFIRNYVINSGALMEELRELVEKNRSKLSKEDKKLPVEALLMNFINGIVVSLPAPDSATLENQLAAFETYNRALDAALEAYVSRDFLDEVGLGEMYSEAEAAVAAIKAYFQRQWLRENNMLSELSVLTMLTEKDKPAFDLLEAHGGHIDGIAKSLERYLKEQRKRNEAREKRLNPEETPTDPDSMTGGGDSDWGADENELGSEPDPVSETDDPAEEAPDFDVDV